MDDSKEAYVDLDVGNSNVGYDPIVDKDDDVTLISILHLPNTTSKVEPLDVLIYVATKASVMQEELFVPKLLTKIWALLELRIDLVVNKAYLEESNKNLAMRCHQLEEQNYNLQKDQILSFELAAKLQSIITQ